jgi:hypothetical protein
MGPAWYNSANVLTPYFFGAKGDGANNDTAAFQSFLNALANGGVGNWDGNWLIDEGVLTLSPTGDPIAGGGSLQVYRAPNIFGRATFTGRGTGSGPFLKIANPVPTNGGYSGGSIGPVTFVDNTKSTLATRHGLFLQGLLAWHFGLIVGYGLGGSVVYTTRQVDGSGDPDPYSNSDCYFDGIAGVKCNALAFDADCIQDEGNYVGWVGAYGLPASGSLTNNGPMWNAGQGSEVHSISSGNSYGWAVVLGNDTSHGNRIQLYDLELGAPQYGVWVKTCEQFVITGRIETGPAADGSGTLWPLTMIKLGGAESGGLTGGRIDLTIRIDPGATIASLGTILDLSNLPLGFLDVNLLFHDEAGLTPPLFLSGGALNPALVSPPNSPVSYFIKNVHPESAIRVTFNGIAVLSQTRVTAIRARIAVNTGSIPGSGFGTLTSKMNGTWSAENQDDYFGILDATNHWFNIVAHGRYRVHCHLTLPVGTTSGRITPGSLIQYALIDDDQSGIPANYNVLYEGATLAVNANGVTTVTMDVAASYLTAGHRVWISLVAQGQNPPGPCQLAAQLDQNGANVFELSLLPPDGDAW